MKIIPTTIKLIKLRFLVKKLLFVVKYVPDQYKTNEMCGKVIIQNSGMSEFFPDEDQEMADKAVDHYSHSLRFVADSYKTGIMYNKDAGIDPFAIHFVSECCKSQEMCDKAVDTGPFAFDSVSDQYLIQEMCYRVVSKELFMLT